MRGTDKKDFEGEFRILETFGEFGKFLFRPSEP